MVKSMRLTCREFDLFVQDFNDLVADKLYSKMEYRMWRKIACYREPDSVVFIEWDDKGADIAFGDEPEWHHFVFGDDSFGDFLLYNVLKKEDDGYWDDPWSPWYEDMEEGKKRKAMDELTHHPAYGYPLSTGHDASNYKKKWEDPKAEPIKVDVMSADGTIHSVDSYTIRDTSSEFYPKKNFKLNLTDTEAINKAVSTRDKMVELLSGSDIGLAAMPADVGPSMSCVVDTKVDKTEFEARLEALAEKVQAVADKYNNNNNDKKENVIMKGFNFDFGPMNGNVVRMSIYGLAVKNKTGSWVAYDAKNEEIMDVDVFNFDGAKFLYRMPVAINDVAAGDVIVHMSVPMFVVGKSEDGKAVYAVDPVAGERKEIMLTKSPFGFNFVTKVVNFLGNAFNADASNPFGNLGLMMMLSEDKAGFKDMLPLMLFANGGNGNALGNIANNPLMLYALMGDKDSDMDPLMMVALMGGFNQGNHVCNCGQHNQ